MKGGTKYLWYVIIAVAAVIIIVAVAKGPNSYQPYASPSPSGSPSVSASPTPKPAAKASPSATAPGTYGDAVTAYANRRIQFDQYCQAVPSSLSIKKGLAIMFDNRSGDARTFAVGGVYFTLPGYGWKIYIPAVTKTPATLYIDCGSARNVGTLIVQ
ncbi:MAG TPA: hypothetical protein VMU12_02700 [Candidatus Paceibacterota bacterium]|nr:hypothetical protein [Candidatus Paceibacterota bacterium]